ncbi:MAG TPA: single-stranded DNA-binding protein [Solirubrobacterales bacterium]
MNVVVVTGNLTCDPELRALPSGASKAVLRVAVNGRRKDGQSGEWVDKPNYFDVIVWGARAEAAAKYLGTGSPVAVEGRLDWREWEVEGGGKRQVVEIVAEGLQFLGSSKRSEEAVASEEESPEAEPEEQLDLDAEAPEEPEFEAQSELDQLTRDQLDARARDLGIVNPERMGKKADVIAEIVAAQEAYEFGEEELDESELSF